MFCTNCGNKLEDSAKFCTGCGTPTNQMQQASKTTQPSIQGIPNEQPEQTTTASEQPNNLGAVPQQPEQQELTTPQPEPQEMIFRQPIQQNVEPQQPIQQELTTPQPEPQEMIFRQPIQQNVELQQPIQQGMTPQQPIQQGMTPQQPIQQGTVPQQPFNQMMRAPFPQAPGSIPQAPNQSVSAPVKKSKKKVFIIAGICAAVIVIGGGTGFFIYQNNIKKQAKNVIAYFDDGVYDKAIDLYEKYSGKQKAFDEAVAEELLAKVELIKKDYLSEKLDYTTAGKQLRELKEYDIDDLVDATDEVTKFIDMIYLSRTNYQDGKEYFDMGDYTSAIMKYSSVVKEDTKYYSMAQKELERAQQEQALQYEEERLSNIRDQALSDAEYYVSYADYTSAITAIEQALSEIPGDQYLTDQLAAYKLQQELTQKVLSISSTRYDYTYTDLGKDVMTVALEFPFLEGESPAYASINEMIELLKNEYISYGESMADTAKEFASDEYFYAYSLDVTYSVKYNQNGVLCILLEGYDYTGGAHGYPIRYTLTFDLATGSQLGLSNLIATDEYTFGSFVTSEFDRMYNEGVTMYWDDAPQTVQNSAMNFSTMNYYITENEITIFFYPYDLASYADGFVEIVIPYAGNEWMFTYLQ